MAAFVGNEILNKAGRGKKDDFYTTYGDIAEELRQYSRQFAGRTVLCNCDDPIESNFVRYFLRNFNSLGLGRLLATCYASSLLAGALTHPEDTPPSAYVPGGAYLASITSVPSEAVKGDGIDFSAIFSTPGNRLEPLEGTGDFRSDECTALMDEADILVTNPPFSLFREYLALTVEKSLGFLIIGNVNALTYRDVFPLFRDGRIWMGRTMHSGDRKFFVPPSYPLDAAGCGVDEKGRRFIKVKGVRWFTNLEYDDGFTPLPLSERYDPERFPRYENYDAINIGRTRDIPKDYAGYMGVPITFLDKYDPEQFEIVMLANGNARTATPKKILESVGYTPHPLDKGGVGVIDGKRIYARVMVRNRHVRGAE